MRVLMLVGDKIRFFVLPASARWNEPSTGRVGSQENLAVTKTTIHRATLWSRYLRLWPFRKISVSRTSKIFYAFSN